MIKLIIEYSFVALNVVGIFFLLVIVCCSIKDYLKTRHETPFWLFLSILVFLAAIRGISNIMYEVFDYSISGSLRLNITFIVMSVFCLFFIFVFLRKKQGIFKSIKRRPSKKKTKHKSGAKKTENKEAQELREGLKIVEEAHKAGVISLEKYEKDKAEITSLLEKNGKNKQLRERVKKIEKFISEAEETADFEKK